VINPYEETQAWTRYLTVLNHFILTFFDYCICWLDKQYQIYVKNTLSIIYFI
jgi:hypothetical protein